MQMLGSGKLKKAVSGYFEEEENAYEVYDEFLSATNFLAAMKPLVALDLESHGGLRENRQNSPEVHMLVRKALHDFLRESLFDSTRRKEMGSDDEEEEDDVTDRKPNIFQFASRGKAPPPGIFLPTYAKDVCAMLYPNPTGGIGTSAPVAKHELSKEMAEIAGHRESEVKVPVHIPKDKDVSTFEVRIKGQKLEQVVLQSRVGSKKHEPAKPYSTKEEQAELRQERRALDTELHALKVQQYAVRKLEREVKRLEAERDKLQAEREATRQHERRRKLRSVEVKEALRAGADARFAKHEAEAARAQREEERKAVKQRAWRERGQQLKEQLATWESQGKPRGAQGESSHNATQEELERDAARHARSAAKWTLSGADLQRRGAMESRPPQPWLADWQQSGSPAPPDGPKPGRRSPRLDIRSLPAATYGVSPQHLAELARRAASGLRCPALPAGGGPRHAERLEGPADGVVPRSREREQEYGDSDWEEDEDEEIGIGGLPEDPNAKDLFEKEADTESVKHLGDDIFSGSSGSDRGE